MKLRDIITSHRAIKRVALPLVNRPSPLMEAVPEADVQRAADLAAAEAGQLAGDGTIDVGLRVLTALETSTVLEKASEYARARNVPDDQLNDRNPIYNLGCSVYTCVLACVDPDSKAADPDPFFGERGDLESAALELLCSPHIGRDGIQYLVAAQQLWQDRCSPTALRVPPSEMIKIVAGLASEDEETALATFLGLRAGMLYNSVRFLAPLLRSLPLHSSLYSSSSTASRSSESAPS